MPSPAKLTVHFEDFINPKETDTISLSIIYTILFCIHINEAASKNKNSGLNAHVALYQKI